MSLGTRLRASLPTQPAVRLFTLASLLDAVGTGLYMATAVILFLRVLELSPQQIGLSFTIAGIVRFASVPLGALGDRLSVRTALIGLYTWRAGCFVTLAFVDGWLALTLVLAAAAFAEGPSGPLTQAAVAGLSSPEQRVQAMAVVRTVRNLGFAVGGGIGAALLIDPGRFALVAAVLGNALTFVVAALLLLRIGAFGATAPKSTSVTAGIRRAARNVRYMGLAGICGFLSIHMTLLAVGIPVWLATSAAVPTWTLPLLIVLNTVLAILLQVPLTNMTAGRGVLSVRLAGAALAACCVLLAVVTKVPTPVAVALAVAGIVLLTLGEIWHATGEWELAYDGAPEEHRSSHLALFSLGTATQEMVGPIILTGIVLTAGVPGWLGLAALLLLAGLASGWFRLTPGSGPAGRTAETRTPDNGEPVPGAPLRTDADHPETVPGRPAGQL